MPCGRLIYEQKNDEKTPCREAISGRVFFWVVVVRFEPQATEKFFGAAVFQKCCRGVGEQPTFAEQIVFRNLFFLLQLHFLKLSNS